MIHILADSEFWEVVGEALVFVGVVLEVLCETKLILKSEDERRDRLEGRGGWILIVGLAVSLAALVATNKHFDSTIADLNFRSSQANARAAAAEKDAAKERVRADKDEKELAGFQGDLASTTTKVADAEERSAKAETRLADETERTARLERLLTWRTISPEQAKQIKDFLLPTASPFMNWQHRPSPFAGQKIQFSYLSADLEAGEYAEDLANTLRDALKDSGAEVAEPSSIVALGQGPPPQGLTLETDKGNNPAAVLLQNALKAAGIDAPGRLGQPPNTITFFVGVQPRPVAVKR